MLLCNAKCGKIYFILRNWTIHWVNFYFCIKLIYQLDSKPFPIHSLIVRKTVRKCHFVSLITSLLSSILYCMNCKCIHLFAYSIYVQSKWNVSLSCHCPFGKLWNCYCVLMILKNQSKIKRFKITISNGFRRNEFVSLTIRKKKKILFMLPKPTTIYIHA